MKLFKQIETKFDNYDMTKHNVMEYFEIHYLY